MRVSSVAGQSGALPEALDPVLPTLARELDPARVARCFQAQWPDPRGTGAISSCVRQHVHWSPGSGCVATFRLMAAPADGHGASTVGVVEIGPDSARHRLFTADDLLPGLAAAADPETLTQWLTDRLNRPLERPVVTPVSYRPGQRCVLRYQLPGPPATVLYGKVLRAEPAEALARTTTALAPTIVPSLVGVEPSWQLLVQADAGRRSLSSAATGRQGAATLAEVGAGGAVLSALHARSQPPGSHRSLVDDIDDLAQYLAPAGRVAPSTAELLADAMARVRIHSEPGDTPVPSHGAFRLDQVHITSGEARLIDLDSYCWAERARDLGNVFAYLRWRAIRHPGLASELGTVRAAFVSGYANAMDLPDGRRVRAFEAVSLLKIAGRRYRALDVAEWPQVPNLIEAAVGLLSDHPGGAG